MTGTLLQRLPKAYVKWWDLPRKYNTVSRVDGLLRISRLADLDPRIIWALQSVRNGSLSYNRRHVASPDLLEFTKYLGYPASWGDFSVVPAYGTDATSIWRKLGVKGRDGIGGIPCELVHGGNGAGNSCKKNISIRGQKAWLAALLIYIPVLFYPHLFPRTHRKCTRVGTPPSSHGQTTRGPDIPRGAGTNTSRSHA